MRQSTTSDTLLLSQIRDKVEALFGHRPCLWQIRVVQAVLKRDKDVLSIAATGSGKSLTFWMPLLFVPEGIQIVISPLNILGKQNVETLKKAGIQAISITAETATAENFMAIAEGKHRAIVTNIETLMKPDGGFQRLWLDKSFASKIISVVWDEAQCISKWGDFRPEYKTAGLLRHLIPRDVPFFVTSATLPPLILEDVMTILQMTLEKTYLFERSNDRANVHLVVRKMKYPLNSYKDLRFLIPDDWDPASGTPLPYKFVIFFDNIADSLEAAKFLRSLLPVHLRHKIKWFNSEMSPEFREEESDDFKEGENWGLACTESFGMGIDLPDISLVIQWRATCDMCTLWQRFGRAARDFALEGIALFLVEPMYFDDTKIEKAARKANKLQKEQNKLTRKRKRETNEDPKVGVKKTRTAVSAPNLASTSKAATSKAPTVAPVPSSKSPTVHPILLATFQPALVAMSFDNDEIDMHAEAINTHITGLGTLLLSNSGRTDNDLEETVIGLTGETGLEGEENGTGTSETNVVSRVLPVVENETEVGDEFESGSESEVEVEADMFAERRIVYMKKGGKLAGKKKSRRDGEELEPALDDLINAGSKIRNIKCYRIPPMLYFGNDKKVSSHKACRPDLPDGCTRCVDKEPTVCCELCTPAFFVDFARVDIEKPPPVASRSRIADYKADAQDMSLRDALHTFRRDATRAKFGLAHLKNNGPGIVMSNEVLQRIIDCAHGYKIDTTEQLERETRWPGVSEHAHSVLQLIRTYRPKPIPAPLLTSTPLQPRPGVLNQDTPATSSIKTVKARKCSKCQALDHIASNRKCPLYAQRQPINIMANAPPNQDQNTIEPLTVTDPPALGPSTPAFDWAASLFPPTATRTTLSSSTPGLLGVLTITPIASTSSMTSIPTAPPSIRDTMGPNQFYAR